MPLDPHNPQNPKTVKNPQGGHEQGQPKNPGQEKGRPGLGSPIHPPKENPYGGKR